MFKYLKKLYQKAKEGELHLVASSLAFSTVLSIIPFVAVCLAILQKLGGLESFYPKVESWILSNFSDTTGQEGIKLIKAAIGRMMSGKMGSIGALFLIITSTRLIADMDSGINRVLNIENQRGLVQRMFSYWLLILTFPFALAGYVALGTIKEFSGITKDLMPVAILVSMLFVLYKVVPAVRIKSKEAFWAAVGGTVMTIAVHNVFIWSSHKIFNYGKLYGGIAALPLILLWVLLVWYSVLLGAIMIGHKK